jgi:hypothetical protein
MCVLQLCCCIVAAVASAAIQVSSSKVTGLPSQNLGPRVTMQRYFIAAQWAEQMAATSQQSGPTARISSTPILNAMPPSSDGNNSQLPAPQEKQQQQQPPLGVVASGASHQSQQQQQNTQQWNFTRSQQKPTVAVITAAGPIMQAAGGGAAAQGDGVVEAHKMTRALRAFRENPQVAADCLCWLPALKIDDHLVAALCRAAIEQPCLPVMSLTLYFSETTAAESDHQHPSSAWLCSTVGCNLGAACTAVVVIVARSERWCFVLTAPAALLWRQT